MGLFTFSKKRKFLMDISLENVRLCESSDSSTVETVPYEKLLRYLFFGGGGGMAIDNKLL